MRRELEGVRMRLVEKDSEIARLQHSISNNALLFLSVFLSHQVQNRTPGPANSPYTGPLLDQIASLKAELAQKHIMVVQPNVPSSTDSESLRAANGIHRPRVTPSRIAKSARGCSNRGSEASQRRGDFGGWGWRGLRCVCWCEQIEYVNAKCARDIKSLREAHLKEIER